MFNRLPLKRLVLFCACIGSCLAVLYASTSLMNSSAHAQSQAICNAPPPSLVKVFVITYFNAEVTPWLNNQNWPIVCIVPGADNVHPENYVRCQNRGVCLAVMGVGKVNATASLMAILKFPELTFDEHTYFLTSGTAAISPFSQSTLGSVALANWVVDWDQGYHLLPRTVPGIPFGYIPPGKFVDSTSEYHLNEALAARAFAVASQVTLPDSVEAIQERLKYPSQVGMKPQAVRCDTVAGDTRFAGRQLSQEAQLIMTTLTRGAGSYCTSELEDTGIATALNRLNHLQCYVNMRAGSAFDQPHPGQTLTQFLNEHFRVDPLATGNLYLVGSRLVNFLLNNPGLC